MNLESGGTGICVEVRVVGDKEINTLYFPAHKYAITIGDYALSYAWKYLYARTSVVKLYDCYDVPTLTSTCELLFLFGSALMGNRDMPFETLVDIVHHLTEYLSMSTCVLNTVEVNIIMYHLMDDSIFHLIFRQVKADADTETEVVEFQLTEQFPSFLIYKHAKEGLGIAQLNGKNREFIIKDKMIKLPKLIFNIFYCWLHLVIARRRPRSALLLVALYEDREV